MTEKLSMASSIRARRDPTSRHSMYVLRQDGPELSFADAVKSHDALLTSIYGSRSVDQHLTTTATAKADVSALGNAGRPRSSAITFPPAANKSSTSSVWQPLFHHTTLVGSAAPLLATFKRDTHVQTENEIRNDVGVQTEEPAIRPTATYKRDVLVQTCEVWADLASCGGDDDVTIGRYSEISPNFVGDTFPTVLPPSPRGECTVKGIYERIPENRNQTDNSAPSFGELVIEVPSQSPVVGANFHNPKDYDPTVPNEKSSIESANFSPHLDSNQQEFLVSSTSPILIQSNRPERSHLAYPDRNYVSFVPICKSEVTYFLPQKLECVTEERICAPSSSEDFENVEFPRLESNNDPALECPSARCFTTYEEIALKDPQSRDSRPNESESALKSGFSPKHNAERFPSRTLSPVKPKTKENRNSLNMDDYKYDRLSSCNTSERGSVVSVLDALYADSFKFESCENLDQLEEEIIRSLCTPVKELEENLKPTFQEDSIKDSECFPSIPYSVQQVERTPVSPRFFSNMSDQQKTEWHSDAKLNVYQANRDSPSDNEVRSPDGMVRTKTPTKIDRSGMQARGEIIEKLMKGECVDAGILNSFDENSVGNLHQNEAGPQPARENEITVDLLPPQSTVSTGILEVRRSSWSAVASATDGSKPVRKANGEMMKHEYNKMDNLSTRSPVRNFVSPSTRDIKLPYPQDPSPTSSLDQTNVTDSIPETYDGEITKSDGTNRPLYWPLQRNADFDSKVKNEFHININSSDEPSSSTKRECFMPPEDNTDTDEKTKSYNPAAPPPPAPPPPPPPPPPPQCYQSVPQINGSSVDNVAKGDSNPSCPPYSKASSPGNSGFSPSNQKDLMMQELTERFQRRQKDSINTQAVRSPQNERINHVENNNSPGCDYKDSANITSHHPSHTQKESSPGSNTTTFKSVWPSTNGEDYRNHNGKDEVYSSTDYKNGIQYNNNYGSHEVFPNPEANQPHQVGSHSPNSSYTGQPNESPGYSSKDDTKYPSPFPKKTIITDEPPPRGAILVDQKVTVEGDQVHTDKYYAVPLKEVLKEKTSTAKFTPAPPKYEGIGPTEDGVPTGLRQSVRKENMSNWYKTMFKSLHKAGHPHYGGYSSDPEFEREEKAIITKCATLDNRQKPGDTTRQTSSRIQHGYPPSAKSTLEVYNAHPRPIEDYEPGYSSAVDNENTTGSKRFLPSLNHPKPSYEFKCGYESDTSVIRKLHQPDSPHPEQQKLWYREIQRGGDIPQYGLGKLAPEKPKEPVIGPAPSPSYHSSPMKPNYPQAVRPHTPPPEYVINNDSGATDVSNGNYSVQMQHAIHAELQRRMSPSSQQTPVGYKTSPKSPSKSPELKMFAKVLYDFVSESPRELNLKKEELVLILKQLDKNWYEGERKGAIGIFPVSYVEILPPEHVSPQVKQPLEGLAKAVYDFRAQTSVELPLKKGDTVSLIRRVDQNWYEGRIQDRKGIFPATYVQVVQEPGESGRSSLSPKPKAAVSPHSVKLQEDCVKKSPSSCPAPPPSYSNTHSSMSISNSPNASGRTKKGSSLVEPVLYRALYGYSPQNADELELLDGDNVYVVEMCDDGWFVGTSVRTGVFGIFPGNYVEKV